MPFIHFITNQKMTEQQKESLKTGFGQKIEVIPGKAEKWLMVCIEDEKNLYFQGKKEKPMAFTEVKIFGHTTAEVYEKLTQALTEEISKLGIAPEQIYIRYSETEAWGWNGTNF